MILVVVGALGTPLTSIKENLENTEIGTPWYIKNEKELSKNVKRMSDRSNGRTVETVRTVEQ